MLATGVEEVVLGALLEVVYGSYIQPQRAH
jgi:hypothetical protein